MKDFGGKTHQLQFGSKVIDYQLKFADRKTLGIAVTPDMEVLVTAPEGSSMERIKEKLHKRAGWILEQQRFFLGFMPRTLEKKYVSGESHYYLGRQLRLQLEIGKQNQVHYKPPFIILQHKPKADIKAVLNDWYRLRAKLKFAEFAEPWIRVFEQYGVSPSGIYIQQMEKRWGSCTAKGKIILNPELIKAPKACIEYVIVHELCHLMHRGHTAAFIALQTKHFPDWEKWKNKLERMLG